MAHPKGTRHKKRKRQALPAPPVRLFRPCNAESAPAYPEIRPAHRAGVARNAAILRHGGPPDS